jgi:hypothetical protein
MVFRSDDREVTVYHVLRTVTDDGEMLTHLPTAERLVGDGFENYADALANAKALRTAAYQHKKTGEVRVLSELETTGAAYRDDSEQLFDVWGFLRAAELVGHRGYALAVEDTSLHLYEPKS